MRHRTACLGYKLVTRRRPIEEKLEIKCLVESFACGSFSWVEVEGGRKEKLLILEKNPVTVKIQTSVQMAVLE